MLNDMFRIVSRNDPRILNPTFDFKIPWVEENEVEIDDDDLFISIY